MAAALREGTPPRVRGPAFLAEGRSGACLPPSLPSSFPQRRPRQPGLRSHVRAKHHRPHHGGPAQRHGLCRLQDGLQGHHPRSDGPQEEAPRLFNTVHK